MKKAKFYNLKRKILELFQEFHFCSNFLRIWLTVSGVTLRKDSIFFRGTIDFKSGQRFINFT